MTTASSYAIKCLSPSSSSKRSVLEREARILAKLPHQHENIVNFRGLSQGFWSDPTTMNCFLVFDELDMTLEQALLQWKSGKRFQGTNISNRNVSSSPPPKKMLRTLVVRPSRRLQHRRKAQAERLVLAAVGLARALHFLHEQRILFRDLKPSNAGFDRHGNIRLFDFGLAQKLPPAPRSRGRDGDAATQETTICPSGVKGTFRYMAPEVASKKPYGLPSDVHSFAMVLWQICALERPYSNAATVEGLQDMLVKGKIRPSLKRIGSPIVAQVLKAAWDPEPLQRPDFGWILQELQREIDCVSVSTQ